MQLGFAVPTAGSWATPDRMVELAQAAEGRGYASLWTFQRLLFPADEAEAANPRWQPVYRSVHDPLVTLAFLAAHTSRGPPRGRRAQHAVVLADPARQAGDHARPRVGRAARPRARAGLVPGGVRRGGRALRAPRGTADDFLACLTAIWTDDPVDYRSEFHVVRKAHVHPRPVQQPHPPVLLGGAAPPALRRAGRLSQGWISSSGTDLSTIGSSIAIVREAATAAGRDADALRFVCRGVVRVRPAGQEQRRPLSGSLDEIRGDLAVIAGQGVTELFVDLNFDREIGAPEADPDVSMRRAHVVLDALAPGGQGAS